MERQVMNNLYQSKGPQSSDCQPSTSRQNKQSGRNNFHRESNKLGNKNGPNRPQARVRTRESKNLKESIESNRIQFYDSRQSLYPDVTHVKKKTLSKSYLRERFVQANCQFVVSNKSGYTEHLCNPDLPITWELVEEVIFASDSSGELCCPICLHYPSAAKITRCGHIYCWPCILHYLALSDKESRSCPICFDNIKKPDLKSVTITKKINFGTDDFLTFTLMKIQKGSTVALPVKYDEEFEHSYRNMNTDSTLDLFYKIFISSSQHIVAILNREENELNTLMEEYLKENMPEVCFVQRALDELDQKQINKFDVLGELTNLNLQDAMVPKSGGEYTYFYQSDDGQPIYLHALNVRMLKHQFGELKNSPCSVTGRIIELHRQTVTEDVRRRYAHLRHLPLSCEFQIAEVAFDTSVVSNETLSHFAGEVNTRKKNRQRKEKAQKIRDRNIDIENNKRIFGILPPPEFKLNDLSDFPTYQESEIDTTILGNTDHFPSSLVQSEPSESSWPSPSSVGLQSSFANMLNQGKSSFNVTLRKKANQGETCKGDTDEESIAQSSMNLTLGDFFNDCVKVNVRKDKRNRKK